MTSFALQALRCCLPTFNLPPERSDTLRAAIALPNLPAAAPQPMATPSLAISTWGSLPTPSAVSRATMSSAYWLQPPVPARPLSLEEEIELRLDWLCESPHPRQVMEALAYLADLCKTSDAAGLRQLARAGTGTMCALLQNRCKKNNWDPQIGLLAAALREAVAQP